MNGLSAQQQAAGLVEVGDGLAGQLADLQLDTTVERCEAVATNLDGARRAVLRLRESLLREGGANVR